MMTAANGDQYMYGDFMRDLPHASTFIGGPQSYREYNQSQLLPIKQMKQNESKDSLQTGYFFESPSKYVSLKKFQSVLEKPEPTTQGQTVSQLSSNVHSQPMYQQAIKNAKEWFERLSIQEKSVVLTVVDKQLVGLIYSMFKIYQQEGNVKFTNRRISPSEASQYHRVR